MRFKLLRRRLSISAPRMIVRSHLPWPLRWAAIALMFGFSAAIALWAFEFGKDIAGLERGSADELMQLRVEVSQLRSEREKAISIANTAESLLRAEKAVQDKLAEQLKAAEADNMAMKSDLGFFERLLPSGASEGVSIRGLQVELASPGHARFQLLVMQAGKTQPVFSGRYEIVLAGTLDGKPWTASPPAGSQSLQLKQYLRLEGMLDFPASAIVKTATVKVMDVNGLIKASLTVRP
jgi:hypothetical protein